jgi:hypothetical protein
MESNGCPSKIQCSQKTADLLIAAGKQHWLEKRPDLVEAKGKGKLQTYWIEPPTRAGSDHAADTTHSMTLSSETDAMHVMGFTRGVDDSSSQRLERLIDWNVDAFTCLLKRIVARRMTLDDTGSRHSNSSRYSRIDEMMPPCTNPRSEVTEVIVLPEFEFNIKTSSKMDVPEISLSPEVCWQLRELISILAYMVRCRLMCDIIQLRSRCSQFVSRSSDAVSTEQFPQL